MRVYQGTIKRGGWLYNMRNDKKVKVPRLVRMHSNELEEIDSISAGDVCAMFGVDCSSMDSFTDGTVKYALTSMFVPAPVISLAVKPKQSAMFANFSKALQRFCKEDPTLQVAFNEKTKETVISGMGELHLEIYVERLKREYNVDCSVGNPNVNYRETIRKKANFNYLHKKQSGGQAVRRAPGTRWKRGR
ncbi:translation elongation factor [Nannochloropsis gaditana]|uniref:Translation elongation factor n=1 Tax=Nannochloropsis gaditana TaxID=72520 RepID=W7TR85_9STRA|nr:translation elongation factor [Nannochloropsis gaditana]